MWVVVVASVVVVEGAVVVVVVQNIVVVVAGAVVETLEETLTDTLTLMDTLVAWEWAEAAAGRAAKVATPSRAVVESAMLAARDFRNFFFMGFDGVAFGGPGPGPRGYF
jgi:hypothetical protein